MTQGFYGEDMARCFRLDHTETLVAHTPRALPFAVTRVRHDAPDHGPNLAPLPREDAYLFSLQLREVPRFRASVAGKPLGACKLKAHALTLTDLHYPPDIHVDSPFDSLVFYLSRAVLDEIASDAGVQSIERFACPLLENVEDPVAYSLGSSLLPILDRKLEADTLFIDHVCWALRYHLALRHAHVQAAPTLGGLTPRQLQRAKELLCAQLDGNTTLAEVATACGMSRSHFVRGFRKSTGVPPHRWLQQRRIERARDLLRQSRAPLREVAQATGFADASHLSRAFSRDVGVSPTLYRRSVRR